MTRRPLVLLGTGEHSAVVAEAARLAGWAIHASVDRQTEQALLQQEAGGRAAYAWHAAFVGAPPSWTGRASRIAAYGDREWATVVHPSAIVSSEAHLGVGSVVLAGAVLQRGARIGDHVVINTGSIVEHDVVIEDMAVLATGCVTGGGARIGKGAYLGMGCRIRDHVTVGQSAVVGMGAVVVRDVLAGATVTGVPARPARGS